MAVEALSTDIREGGSWSLLQRAKNGLLYFAARSFLLGASALSRPALRRVGAFLGACVRMAAPRERERARANLLLVMPELSREERDSLITRCFRSLGEELGDVIATLLRKRETTDDVLDVDAEGAALLTSLHAKGKGVVLASAHLGNWERVGAALVRVPLPVVAVVREAYDPRFDAWLEAIRRRAGMETIARGAKGAAFRLVRALRSNKVLAIPMDLRSRVSCVRVPFLGHPADTARGPARLALRLSAPVVVATLRPATGAISKSCVTVTEIETTDLEAGESGERLLTARINAELSRRILAAPHLWPWMHGRW